VVELIPKSKSPFANRQTTRTKEEEMKLEIHNGEFVGTAEWQEPGRVALDMKDPKERRWFESYFAGEEAFLGGPVECPEMLVEKRDESEAAFDRAVEALALYAYSVKRGDGRRTEAHHTET
jgi:hypothetical protein